MDFESNAHNLSQLTKGKISDAALLCIVWTQMFGSQMKKKEAENVLEVRLKKNPKDCVLCLITMQNLTIG